MATSKLEKYLSNKLYSKFGSLYIRQNYRPDWMEGLELDFYIESFNLAAEVQGKQHYSFVEFFHRSKDGFEEQKDRDAKKQIICRERKIKLFEVFTEKDADLFVELVKEKSRPFLKYDENTKKPKIKQDKNISKNDSPLAYINNFCTKVQVSGMKAYQKQIETVLLVASRLNTNSDLNKIAIENLNKTIGEIKEIIPTHNKRKGAK